MEEILGEIIVGLVEVFAATDSPKAFVWLIVILAVIGGIFYLAY